MKKIKALLLSVFFLVLAACTGGNVLPDKQVTLKYATLLPEAQFEREIAEPVSKHFANIRLQYTRMSNKNTPYDIMHSWGFGQGDLTQANPYYGFDSAERLEPLMATANLRLGTFDTHLIDEIRTNDEEGRLLALPYSTYMFTLAVNRAVFQDAGVSLPDHIRSWTDAVRLAESLPDGYKLDILSSGSWRAIADQLALPFTKHKALEQETRSHWAALIKLVQDVYAAPGNQVWHAKREGTDTYNYWNNIGPLLEDLPMDRVAMTINRFLYSGLGNQPRNLSTWPTTAKDAFPYTLYPFPLIRDASSDIAPASVEQYLTINRESEHKKESMDVIAYLLSEEHQQFISGLGTVPSVLTDRTVASFGHAAEKNLLSADFLHRSASSRMPPGRNVDHGAVTTRTQMISAILEKVADRSIDGADALNQIMQAYSYFME